MDLFLCSDPGFGSFTQIVTAGAAVVAASTGLYGVINAVRTYRASKASQDRQADNERRDQARFVHPMVKGHCWLALPDDPYFDAEDVFRYADEDYFTEGKDGDGRSVFMFNRQMLLVRVELTNGSAEVISNITVGLTDEGELPILRLTGASRHYLLPKSADTCVLSLPWDTGELPDMTWWRATVVFTDARGNVWTRETGQPVMDFSGSH
jgi:hypothetical protein